MHPFFRALTSGMEPFGGGFNLFGSKFYGFHLKAATLHVTHAWTSNSSSRPPLNLDYTAPIRFFDEVLTQQNHTQDAQTKFDLARGYKNHLKAVSQDRELEEWFEDWGTVAVDPPTRHT